MGKVWVWYCEVKEVEEVGKGYDWLWGYGGGFFVISFSIVFVVRLDYGILFWMVMKWVFGVDGDWWVWSGIMKEMVMVGIVD